MATSQYFQSYTSSAEQNLIEDLVTECIRIHGIDLYYIPRIEGNYDKLYGEDKIPEYKNAYFVEMYIKTHDGFVGEGDLFSKFNLEIRDRLILTISRRTFANEVGSQFGINRPMEGDLIFFPLNNKIWQIKFVEHEAIFYQVGSLQTYDLTCELFEYSGEKLNTGIDVIDEIEKLNSINMGIAEIITNTGMILTGEDGYPIIQSEYSLDVQTHDFEADNKEIQKESIGVLDFSEINPFAEEGY